MIEPQYSKSESKKGGGLFLGRGKEPYSLRKVKIERRPRVLLVVLQKTILGGYGLREKRSGMWMLRVSRKIVVKMGLGVYGADALL
jgi:hypothetical protein